MGQALQEDLCSAASIVRDKSLQGAWVDHQGSFIVESTQNHFKYSSYGRVTCLSCVKIADPSLLLAKFYLIRKIQIIIPQLCNLQLNRIIFDGSNINL
jgi:hypothetical protein